MDPLGRIDEDQQDSLTDITSTQRPNLPYEIYKNDNSVPWKFVKHLGDGAAGFVEAVRDTRKADSPERARKRFKRDTNEEAKNNFLLELKPLLDLERHNHRHLIQFIEGYQFRLDYYIVMAPVGETLEALLEHVYTSKRSEARDADFDPLRRAFGCLANGLAFLHSHYIRHKDIKPSNIIMYNKEVRYTDFGLAKKTDPSQTTSLGQHAGTARYCAAEFNHNRHSYRSDVFSLGCVYLEMIAAFVNVYPKSSPEWPLFESRIHTVRGSYTHNVGGFQTWLGRYRGTTLYVRDGNKLPMVIPELCLSMIENDFSRRMDSSHLYHQLRIAESKFYEDRLFCAACRSQESSRDIHTKERWYCGGCNTGPVFDHQDQRLWNTHNCNEGPSKIVFLSDKDMIVMLR